MGLLETLGFMCLICNTTSICTYIPFIGKSLEDLNKQNQENTKKIIEAIKELKMDTN